MFFKLSKYVIKYPWYIHTFSVKVIDSSLAVQWHNKQQSTTNNIIWHIL